MFKNLKTKKGYALVLVIVVMAVLTILGTALMSLSFSETRLSIKQADRLQAHYIAQTGLDTVAKYIINDPTKAVNGTQISSNSLNGGNFVTTIIGNNGSTIKLQSVGTSGTNNTTSETLYLEMTLAANTSTIFNNVVYSDSPDGLNVSGGSINGPLQSKAAVTVYNKSADGKSYTGSNGNSYMIKENMSMNLPKFIIPTLINQGDLSVGNSSDTITQDGEYTDISIGPNGILTFTPPANGILKIVTTNIECKGNISITDNGGKVYLFVRNSATMQTPHSGSSINLVIFLGNYDNNGNYILDNKNFSGEFQTKGNGSFDGYIYGPKASINNNSHSTIHGAIICDTFSLSKFTVNYVPFNSTFDFNGILLSGYQKSLYSNR